MKKFALVLILAVVAVAAAAANRSVAKNLAAGQAVPGTEVDGNIAKAKDGYRFVKNRRAANVERTRIRQIVGAYVCINGMTGQADHCRLDVRPTIITCTGEAGGNAQCALRPKLLERN